MARHGPVMARNVALVRGVGDSPLRFSSGTAGSHAHAGGVASSRSGGCDLAALTRARRYEIAETDLFQWEDDGGATLRDASLNGRLRRTQGEPV